MPRAYWLPLLHAHLPFVRHPEFNDPIEERWLHEAVVECYLPLLEVLRGWRRDGVPFRLTLSLSPPLVAMLDDPLLRGRARRYLETRLEFAGQEIFRTRPLADVHPIAVFYRDRLARLLRLYDEMHGDLPGAFAAEAAAGGLDLLTCTATHGFLPLLQPQPALVRLQVRVGAEAYRRRFGTAATGLWNAECGFFRGLDAEFVHAGLRYFFAEAHAIERAGHPPRRGIAEPLRCPAGPAVFGRDPQTSREVWNACEGYPGDPAYREFHRDIGYDLEFDYVRPYIHESGLRLPTGLKYHAVTGRVALDRKAWYDPAAAHERVRVHAADFIAKRAAQAAEWVGRFGAKPPPLITSPYDCELFGHWWFEGPAWFDQVMRGLCRRDSPVAPITAPEYLARHGELQTAAPAFSSWGEGGYGAVWLAEENRWIYPELHAAGEHLLGHLRAPGPARAKAAATALRRRALNQFARELLLAQSSDWAFLITMRTAPEYATRRTRDHLAACAALHTQLSHGAIDADSLTARENQYNLFPWLDVREMMN
jgi:1,4-alpha-glucan branching enzyme